MFIQETKSQLFKEKDNEDTTPIILEEKIVTETMTEQYTLKGKDLESEIFDSNTYGKLFCVKKLIQNLMLVEKKSKKKECNITWYLTMKVTLSIGCRSWDFFSWSNNLRVNGEELILFEKQFYSKILSLYLGVICSFQIVILFSSSFNLFLPKLANSIQVYRVHLDLKFYKNFQLISTVKVVLTANVLLQS